ncbi:sigma-70 family RNA polymerase sigma factor [Nocardia macrotermitis]|uniref:ECF RNA polymerase sigma factor SigG n=1 Tax=Nocardia macrotermitis TaxID=2585198 RepID=A0A7K0D397_9NOCA|nr:sigma-70 family RNA polymerase sigma factor [Nocardia macrotermitis]MQY19742.1 ECF RNA polymerase sigma factor SigG [Nocardia macrotermitis]
MSTEPFDTAAQRYRGELFAYCYRMLGSPHDADDAVQETYLKAWRGYDGFQGRSSLRTWLYRIATHTCLRAIERRARRAYPSGLGGPVTDPTGPLRSRRAEIAWVEPVSDTELDPAEVAAARHTLRLAFIAALQHLPGRQRAVLILREVLMFHADEVADLLGTTTAAVNSALQRARAQLAKSAPHGYDLAEPQDARQRTLLDRYATAFTRADIDGLVQVLTEDAVFEMPPIPSWFRGRDHIVRFLATRLTEPDGRYLMPTTANGQPAFGLYTRGHGGVLRAHALQLLTVGAAGIARIDMIHDPTLFPRVGLPHLAPADVTPNPVPAQGKSTSCSS